MTDNHAVEQLFVRLTKSLEDDSFIRLRLSGVAAADRAEKIQIRLVELNKIRHLSFTLSYPTRDETKNHAISDGLVMLREMVPQPYRNAYLSTTQGDWQLMVPPKGPARMVAHRAKAKQTPSRSHDADRQTILDQTARDWLQGLGVVGANGQVMAQMTDKYRQINRYLEILSHLANDCGWLKPAQDPTAKTDLVFADMGCGKGYLTFGAWHLFHRKYQLPMRIFGIEQRPELVASGNQLAQRIGAQGLQFLPGAISSVALPQVDALVALHACNTATDDAIRRGIELGARLIVVAPCCHRELREQAGHIEPLAPILKYGIMEERFSEWLTDGLRALHLEWAGYDTKIIEFIASEHTPKNLMISGVRSSLASCANPAVQAQIVQLKRFAGIQKQALD